MYSIKKVSELLGIPVVTIRAWENRYGIITPNRSEGGHRSFSEEDISKLRYLKKQMEENGVKISEAVHMLQQETSLVNVEKNTISNPGNTYDKMIEELYDDLIAYNTSQANETIDLAFSMYEFENVFHYILVPVLHRIGSDWESGLLNVTQEHFASQIILHRFSQLFRILPIDQRLPKVLAFCPEDEHHQIGLMHFTLFLKKKGHDVIYLGPNTPVIGLSSIIKMKNISIITISVTASKHIETVYQWIESTIREYPTLRIVLGGSAFEQHHAPLQLPNVHYPDHKRWDDWYESVFLTT
ncbi:MerR family transcriptional regulator [Cohnella herbarum]|uniref:MerR family transcriptional regulator n=1 Tax=Cohnella herbarum TaxID=2728023 RepID=A0A7Z2ZKK5_9BACL|nr:MerR family transcriptional regulator [Cohnella herbarum]QJD82207.1 MerR family transcriptional regulator [Cohnella herbarum]